MEFKFGNYTMSLDSKIPKSTIMDYDYDEGRRFPSEEYYHLQLKDPITDIICFEVSFMESYSYDIMFILATYSGDEDLNGMCAISFGEDLYDSSGIRLFEDKDHLIDFYMMEEKEDVYTIFTSVDRSTGEICTEIGTVVNDKDIESFFDALSMEFH